MHALPECSAALSVKLGKRPYSKERGRIQLRLETKTRRLRDLSSAAFCHKQQQTRNAFPPFTYLVCAKARRGLEPRLPDSESGVLTVIQLGQMPLSGNPTAVIFAQAEQSQGHVLDPASGNKNWGLSSLQGGGLR